MQFYSDVTRKMYPTPEACEAAEREYLAAAEAKKNEKQLALNALAELKALYNEKATLANEAVTDSKNIYNALSKAAHEFYSKYGYLPEEYRDLNFLLSVFTRF